MNETVFKAFEAYDFDSDSRFTSQLASLPNPPADQTQLKWFYYSKFKTPFDLKEYIAWKSQQQDQVEPNIIPSSQPIEPVYPSSFMHLCDLVAKGVQIAGIKQIPLKINELQAKEACLERRKKPWE